MRDHIQFGYVFLLFALSVSSVGSAKNCANVLDGGYVFAAWAFSDSRTEQGKQLDAYITKICQEVDCPIFCSDENSKVPKDILSVQASCRNKDKAACAKFWDFVGLKSEPNGQEMCFFLGGKACDLCYFIGGPFCNSNLRFGEPIHDSGTALQHKIACNAGIQEACAGLERFKDNNTKEDQESCDAKSDSSACGRIVDTLVANGKSKEAVTRALDFCKKGTHETCLAFYESPDRRKITDQQKVFNADYTVALDSECKTSKLLQACYAWADINKSSNPVAATGVFRTVCMASPVDMNEMFHGACFETLDRSLESKNWADAEVAKGHLCRFYKQRFGETNGSCHASEQKIKIAKGGTDLLSANASCKADGKKTYYDKNGNSTLTLSCKAGLLDGDSEFHSEWSDSSNWFSDPVKIHYVRGIATGSVITGSANYNLTDFLYKDGRVNGKFKRIQTKTAGMAYPYTEGQLVDGLLHGEVKTDTNETEFYDHGKLKWVIDRRGVKEQSFNRCPDGASGESVERFVEKHVTLSKCVWPDKRDRIIDPVKGVVSKLRVPAKNGGYEMLTFNNGVVTESRDCNSKSELSRIRLYGHRLDEKGSISFATMPYFKILDVEVRNGKLHGASQHYQAGTFSESVMYENGALNEKTRRYGTAAVNCPGIRKGK